jgi:hypothetical protein
VPASAAMKMMLLIIVGEFGSGVSVLLFLSNQIIELMGRNPET